LKPTQKQGSLQKVAKKHNNHPAYPVGRDKPKGDKMEHDIFEKVLDGYNIDKHFDFSAIEEKYWLTATWDESDNVFLEFMSPYSYCDGNAKGRRSACRFFWQESYYFTTERQKIEKFLQDALAQIESAEEKEESELRDCEEEDALYKIKSVAIFGNGLWVYSFGNGGSGPGYLSPEEVEELAEESGEVEVVEYDEDLAKFTMGSDFDPDCSWIQVKIDDRLYAWIW
jgi:hypothetical protein